MLRRVMFVLVALMAMPLKAQSLTEQMHQSAIDAITEMGKFVEVRSQVGATLSLCYTRIPKIQRKLNQFNGSAEEKKVLQQRFDVIKSEIDEVKRQHDANKLTLQTGDKEYKDGEYQELLARTSINENSIIAYAKEAIRLYKAAQSTYAGGKRIASQNLYDAEQSLNILNEFEASFTY